jgi:hypothetical protein
MAHLVIRSGLVRTEHSANAVLLFMCVVVLCSSFFIALYSRTEPDASARFTQQYQGIDQAALINHVQSDYDASY